MVGGIEHGALEEVEVREQLDDLRDRDEQTERRHQLGDRGSGAQMPEQGALEKQAQEWRHDEHRQDERRQERPVVVGDRVVEDRRRHERLRPKGQVEHA